VTIALRPTGRVITDRYRAVRARLGKNSGVAPLMGMARHIVVADTDAAALDNRAARLSALAQQFSLAVPASWRRAADRGALSRDVRRTHGAGQRVAGSPRTVRDFISAEIAATGANYLLSWFAFGDMTLKESLASLELFAREVMPAFAD